MADHADGGAEPEVPDQPTAIVRAYLSHINAHALDAAMACLSGDFQLEFAGTDFRMSRTAVRQALEWDAGTNGRLEWAIADTAGHAVHVVGRESNAFLELLGIGALPFRSRFDVRDALIVAQVHDVDWGGNAVEDALQPAVAWATTHEPAEIAAIYPDGKLVYTREGGERWVALLGRWRAAIA